MESIDRKQTDDQNPCFEFSRDLHLVRIVLTHNNAYHKGMTTWLLYLFLLLPVAVHAETTKLSNEFRCGLTKLTQWQVNSVKKTATKLRTTDFTDRYCEPVEPPGGAANAKTIFLDSKGKPMWERSMMVSQTLLFDKIKNKKLNGGRSPLKESLVQIKLPWNKFTMDTKAIKIQMNDGTSYGPLSL